MKSQNRIPAAVLTATPHTGRWRIHIELSNRSHCDIIWNNRQQAQEEFSRIRGASVYAGSWITAIELTQLDNNSKI